MSRSATLRERALLLKAVDYGEADRIATLFTEESGCVAVLAKGWRRPGLRAAARSLPPLTLLEVEWRPGRSALGRLRAAEAVHAFPGLLEDWRKVQAAGRTMAWLRSRLATHVPEPVLFEACVRWFDVLADSQGDVQALALGFRLHALSLLGARPILESCVRCGRAVPPGRAAGFCAEAGGVRCRRCGGGSPVLPTSWMAWMRSCCAGAWATSPPDDALLAAVEGAVERFAEVHLSPRSPSAGDATND